ncbi:MAG: hypothetical protein K2K06_03410 [Oscillospiraceae bacterium]|nr:hypothetical protein [Oscillospiraceae bacterium]
MMNYDVEYEIFKNICKEADEYVPLKELLNNNHLTFQEALQKVSKYRKDFFDLLDKYKICPDNIASVCMDLINLIKENPKNWYLQYIYCAVVTDRGLLMDLNPGERTEEQDIRNWIEQKRFSDDLMAFLHEQYVMKKRLQEIFKILKNPCDNISEYEEELDDILHMTLQHDFLSKWKNNKIYYENIGELMYQVNSHAELQSLKPYIISAILSRRITLMTERKHYIPNIKSVLKYQEYNIYKDNGRNFNAYQSALELYEHLRRYYEDSPEVDIVFSDYCFANLSPLSEWYYQNCKPNEPIPMNVRRKVMTVMAKSFPILLNYKDYEIFDENEIQIYYNAEDKLRDKILNIAEYLI